MNKYRFFYKSATTSNRSCSCRFTLGIGTLFIILLVFYYPQIISHAVSNVGLVIVLRNLVHTSIAPLTSQEQLPTLFESAKSLEVNNKSSYRGYGFHYWQQGKDALAIDQWAVIPFTEQDYLAFSRNETGPDEAVLRWLKAAEHENSTIPELWTEVGIICQRNPIIDDMCMRFLAYNESNWFVDPDFRYERRAWRFNRRIGAQFGFTQCPELEQQCATVQIEALAPEHGASWHQCMTIHPGATYLFSVWLKVETNPDGEWRPLYFQGNIGGEPKGSWSGNQSGSRDWSQWEMSFVADNFDKNWVCFHPVRLEGSGQIWFHSATLKQRENNVQN